MRLLVILALMPLEVDSISITYYFHAQYRRSRTRKLREILVRTFDNGQRFFFIADCLFEYVRGNSKCLTPSRHHLALADLRPKGLLLRLRRVNMSELYTNLRLILVIFFPEQRGQVGRYYGYEFIIRELPASFLIRNYDCWKSDAA